MCWIKSIADGLTMSHNTQNPFEIASNLNIMVILWDLHEEINGFFKYDRRNKFIYINSNLSDEMQTVVCAHELGHAILHPRANTPFMRKNTFFSIAKIEIEANIFAAELLISDDSLSVCNHFSIFEIASLHNVPTELAMLKCKELF
ncbi:ImmA/IrrE family metallo-endopeptidase [Psychrobacillus sp. FSL K6-1464]|uniref:ImmA/IrrE family metallo-endopeptidase n=1 Tax=Psychrobacillus sp. FSL K6-1464 TaxID=2921545 RepID=UPI0030FBB2BC